MSKAFSTDSAEKERMCGCKKCGVRCCRKRHCVAGRHRGVVSSADSVPLFSATIWADL